jgi:hypothetical protein
MQTKTKESERKELREDDRKAIAALKLFETGSGREAAMYAMPSSGFGGDADQIIENVWDAILHCPVSMEVGGELDLGHLSQQMVSDHDETALAMLIFDDSVVLVVAHGIVDGAGYTLFLRAKRDLIEKGLRDKECLIQVIHPIEALCQGSGTGNNALVAGYQLGSLEELVENEQFGLVTATSVLTGCGYDPEGHGYGPEGAIGISLEPFVWSSLNTRGDDGKWKYGHFFSFASSGTPPYEPEKLKDAGRLFTSLVLELYQDIDLNELPEPGALRKRHSEKRYILVVLRHLVQTNRACASQQKASCIPGILTRRQKAKSALNLFCSFVYQNSTDGVFKRIVLFL